MTPEEAQAQRERILRYWNHWREILGVDEWKTRNDFYEGEFIDQAGDPSRTAIATTHVRWEYRFANIAWNLEVVAKESDEALEEHVIHEAMHILINEMREDEQHHEERVATSLAMAFMRTDSRLTV